MNDITLSQLYDNASNCIGSFNFDTNIARNFTKKNSGIKKTYASAYIGLSPYKTQDLISQLAILDRGGGGGLRLLQHSATSVSASYHFKFRAASLWNLLATDLLQLPKLSLFKSAIRNKLLADDLAFFD